MAKRLVLALSAVGLLACGGGDGDDDRPDGSTSAVDARPPDAQPPAGCAFNDPPCGGETICISNACVPAFGRIYRITVVSGTLPEQNPNTNDCWDATCGAPDPFVDTVLNGTSLGVTPTASDTYNPTWNVFADASVPGGSSLTFYVWDEDISSNDYAFGCSYDPLPADVLRAGYISCDFPEGTLFVTIAPR